MVSKGQGANKVNVKEGGKVPEEVMKKKDGLWGWN